MQIRSKVEDRYIHYIPCNNIGDWKAEWFYIDNHAPPLPDRAAGAPQTRDEWFANGQNAEQENELLDKIEYLKKKGVTGASVVFAWIARRIQPLQKRCNLGFEYIGLMDPSRFSSERMAESEALRRVRRVLNGVDIRSAMPKLYHVNNPPDQVNVQYLE